MGNRKFGCPDSLAFPGGRGGSRLIPYHTILCSYLSNVYAAPVTPLLWKLTVMSQVAETELLPYINPPKYKMRNASPRFTKPQASCSAHPLANSMHLQVDCLGSTTQPGPGNMSFSLPQEKILVCSECALNSQCLFRRHRIPTSSVNYPHAPPKKSSYRIYLVLPASRWSAGTWREIQRVGILQHSGVCAFSVALRWGSLE